MEERRTGGGVVPGVGGSAQRGKETGAVGGARAARRSCESPLALRPLS